MRLIEVFLIFMIAVLAVSDSVATTNNDQVRTTSAGHLTDSSRKLVSFDNDSSLTNKHSNSRKSSGLSATEEERLSSTATSWEAGRTGSRTTSAGATTTKNADGTITNSKYYNNGLVQKFQRWWNGIFKSKSTRRLRQA
ncbi:hypothetical protein JG687_00013629 [Phytophthora cactorum]|uniref:RxLR effector protein n=1 Tax=Phytophthora cactorum TaxID=29920 RepID=A0A329S499_9STRA|nr:hypothetical protein Pcac1_g7394 [Phytophthora cactorum]KAG2818339.1 hypothetical protein PC111_g12356 [Phytophthora cactorum]KAG2824638.1 hypothetical protein PC112_g10028 [Phytophthora cactorum]KAG2858249.1 hypothetical protein PC113_g9984 [Phytophthora cactorum]KAG2906812.1 hypothetical protein PC114_g11023 [Phytophthora cactorum]